MTDKMTPEQRHYCMSHVRSKNTKPEVWVRRYLFAHGFRYRIHVKDLPGKPDIVLRKYRTVIFVNGCFWHGHEGCRSYSFPKSNVEFWQNKIESNRKRDLRSAILLRSMGWHVIKIWECQLKPKIRTATLISLKYTLNHIFLMNQRSTQTNMKPYEEYQLIRNSAAEDAIIYGNRKGKNEEDGYR